MMRGLKTRDIYKYFLGVEIFEHNATSTKILAFEFF